MGGRARGNHLRLRPHVRPLRSRRHDVDEDEPVGALDGVVVPDGVEDKADPCNSGLRRRGTQQPEAPRAACAARGGEGGHPAHLRQHGLVLRAEGEDGGAQLLLRAAPTAAPTQPAESRVRAGAGGVAVREDVGRAEGLLANVSEHR